MTDLIDRPTPGKGSSLYRDRTLSMVQEGRATWPNVERRRAPRRRDESSRGVDRRVAHPPVQSTALDATQVERTQHLRHHQHVAGYRRAVISIDVAAALAGAIVAQLARFGVAEGTRSALYWWGALLLPTLWVFAIAASRAYESRFLASSTEEYRRVINAAVGLIAIIAVVSYLFKTEIARGYVVLALPSCAAIAVLGRYFARHSLRRARAHGKYLQNVLVVGHEWAVLDLVAELRRAPDSGLLVVGACVPGGRGSQRMVDAGIPVVGDLGRVVESVAHVDADVLAVTTCVEFGGPELRQACWALENTGVDVVVAPAVVEVAGPRVHIRPVSGLPLLHVEKPEFTGARRVIKGVFDYTSAVLALILSSPLWLLIALSVKCTSRGPVLFRQTRVGIRGETFTMLKFRSMTADAEERLAELRDLNVNSDGLLFKVPEDPRVTRVGRLLRRYSLDELPQLINVLKGDMSFVGPRPPLPYEVERYADDVRRRLLVRPGLTGLWQISGRSDLAWDDAIRLDLRYVENWSLIYDFQILWKTASVVLRGSGAY